LVPEKGSYVTKCSQVLRGVRRAGDRYLRPVKCIGRGYHGVADNLLGGVWDYLVNQLLRFPEKPHPCCRGEDKGVQRAGLEKGKVKRLVEVA